MLESEEPNIVMGAYCTSPYSCDFSTYCSSLVPAVEKTTSFVFSAWVRGDGSPSNVVEFTGPGTKYQPTTLTKEWQRIHQVITITPHDKPANPLYGFHTDGTVWIDAMQFEKGTEPTDYEKRADH